MDFIEPCFGIGHNLSLICQMTSEDIKHQLIIIIHTNKTYIHKHQTQIFGRLVPLILPLVKEHIRVGHATLQIDPRPYPTDRPRPYPTDRPRPYPTNRPPALPYKQTPALPYKQTPGPTLQTDPRPYPTNRPRPYPTNRPRPYPTDRPRP